MGFGKKKGGVNNPPAGNETLFDPDLALSGPPMPGPAMAEDDYEKMLAADRAQRSGAAPVQKQPDPMDIMFDNQGPMAPAAPMGKPKLKYRPKYDPSGGSNVSMQEIFCARCQTPIAIPEQRPVEITCSVCADVRVYT